MSDTSKQQQLAALKRDLAIGIEDLEAGRYQTYNDSNIMHLAEDISRCGRARLKALRMKVTAKVHGKKK